jgi:hypothetical protein
VKIKTASLPAIHFRTRAFVSRLREKSPVPSLTVIDAVKEYDRYC